MKKRVFSFVIVLITLFALIAFGAPNIINENKVGMEFNGGFDILYEINTENDELSASELTETAAGGIKKRLDIANVIDPIVSIEGNKYVRVTVSAANQILADEIREVVETSTEITFRDFENNLLVSGDDILKEVGASYDENTGAILLHISDTEKLGEITEKVKGLSTKNLVVWLGWEEGDDYANYKTDVSTAKKIIYNAEVTSKLTTDTITVSGSFTKAQAMNTINLINSETLDYDIDIVQISSIEADYAQTSFNKVLIAGLVALVLVFAGLVVFYKVAGVVSFVSLAFTTFLSLTLFIAFKGIITQQTVSALIVSLAVSIDAIVILLERVKHELYNGKNLVRALNEGYKKALPSMVDVNIIVFLVAVIMYVTGDSVSNFALMLALSSACSLVVMTILNKYVLSLLVKLNISPSKVGAKKAYLENKEAYTNSKLNNTNILEHKKKALLGIGSFAGLAIVVMLVLQLFAGSLFNYNSTIQDNSTVTIISTDNVLTNESEVMAFFGQEGINIELEDIDLTTVKTDDVTKYKVFVSTSESITDVEKALRNAVVEKYGENLDYDERYELYINDINPQSTVVSLVSALTSTGIALLVVGLYLSLRYRYSYGIASVISSSSAIILTALFLGLFRIPVGSDVVIAIYSIAIFSTITLIVIYSRLKEILTSNHKKYISNSERYAALTKSINAALPRTLITTVFMTVISIALLAFASLSTYSYYIALVLGIITSAVAAIFISSVVWMLFETRSDKKKRTFKPKKKNPYFKESKESTFVGIND